MCGAKYNLISSSWGGYPHPGEDFLILVGRGDAYLSACSLFPAHHDIRLATTFHFAARILSLLERRFDTLSYSPSAASQSKLLKVHERMSVTFVRGLLFTLPSSPPAEVPGFSWPPSERLGYDAAVPWIQKHMCPEGVSAVLYAEDEWLEWWVQSLTSFSFHPNSIVYYYL